MNFIKKLWSKINWKSWITYTVLGVVAMIAITVIINIVKPMEIQGEAFTVSEGVFVKSFKTNGKALPHIYSDITAMSDGFVSVIYHNVGDRVAADTPILKLSNPDMEKIYRDAELTYNQAKLDYGRDTALYNGGAITRYEYQASELKYKQAENNYKQTKEKVFAIAPINGVVYAMNLTQGQSYRAGTVLASVGDTGWIEIKIFVDQPDISKLYIGEKCEITSDAIPNQMIAGQVVNIPENVTTQGSRTGVEVVVAIDKGSQVKLLPNTKINARLIIKTIEKTRVIPIEAVYDDENGGKYVYKIGADRGLIKTTVTTGEYNDTQYQLLTGLTPGDRVLVGATLPKNIPANKKLVFREKPKV